MVKIYAIAYDDNLSAGNTSVCPSGYASTYFPELGCGEWEVRDVQTSPTSWSIPKGSSKGATIGKTRATRCWSVRSCACSMPDRTRPWRRRGIPVRSEAPDRIDHGGHDDDAASGGGRSAPGHLPTRAARAVDASWVLLLMAFSWRLRTIATLSILAARSPSGQIRTSP